MPVTRAARSAATRTGAGSRNVEGEEPQKDRQRRAVRASTIPALRAKIDRIDRDLVALMNERAKLAHQIGKIKDANGQQCYDPAREEEVLARVAELSRGPAWQPAACAAFFAS